jgi:hypothetical protein
VDLLQIRKVEEVKKHGYLLSNAAANMFFAKLSEVPVRYEQKHAMPEKGPINDCKVVVETCYFQKPKRG